MRIARAIFTLRPIVILKRELPYTLKNRRIISKTPLQTSNDANCILHTYHIFRNKNQKSQIRPVNFPHFSLHTHTSHETSVSETTSSLPGAPAAETRSGSPTARSSMRRPTTLCRANDVGPSSDDAAGVRQWKQVPAARARGG